MAYDSFQKHKMMKNQKHSNNASADELLKAEIVVRKYHSSFMSLACIRCAVELGIPDVVHKHDMITLSQLISDLPIPIHPSKSSHVYRLMRVLVNAGFFVEQTINMNPIGGGVDEQCFSLTTAGQLLTPVGSRMGSRLFPLAFSPPMLKPWTHLSKWYTNDDETAFETAHGKKFWDYFGEDPALRNVFNEAMAGDSEFTSKLLIDKCHFTFEGLESLVDVGGGTGTTASHIALNFQNIKCSVFDLPNVVANQKGTANLDFVGGSMFDDIPQANAILLKFILHNWNDEECIRILKNCKKAINPCGGKVIVIDVVMVEAKASNDSDVLAVQNCFDMLMLVEFGGRERTEKDFAILFQKAGFSSYKLFPVLGYKSFMEVYF